MPMSKPPRGAVSVLLCYETVRNARNLNDVMLSKAKHLAFSGGYESRDSSAAPQNDITTQSL